MNNPLIDNISNIINRSLEEQVYKRTLAMGYTPDRDVYLSDPLGYSNKKLDIVARKNFCIDIFGHGSSADRDTEYIPRMVINGLGFSSGSLGNDGLYYPKLNITNNYDRMLAPLRSSNYRFEIELCSNKTDQDAVLEHIRSKALPNLQYIPIYNSESDSLLLQYENYRRMPSLSHGLIKKIYSYSIIDVFETLPETVGNSIAKIREITIKDSDNTNILSLPK